MTIRVIALFGHVVGMLALFVGLAIEWLSFEFVSLSSSPSTPALSARLKRTSRRITGIAAGLILTSGIYLAAQTGVLGFAWVRGSFGAMVLMAVLGGVSSRSTSNFSLRVSLRTRVAVGLAIVYLMIAKPDLLASVVVVGLSVLIGVAASLARWTNRSTVFDTQATSYGRTR